MTNKRTTVFEGDVYVTTSLEPTVYGTGLFTIEGDLTVNGAANILGGIGHSVLNNLDSDDHTQYALLEGRTTGQILVGGISASDNLTLRSTSNASKGSIILDETTASTSNSTGSLKLSGGLGISNTTDSSSSTNGGTITTAGGAAIAKKLYVGGDTFFSGIHTTTRSGGASIHGIVASSATSAAYTRFENSNTGETSFIGTDGTGLFDISSGSLLLATAASNTNKNIIFSPGSVFTMMTIDPTKVSIFSSIASTSNSTGTLLLSGGLGISDTTDATSSTNGGTITTAGGVAIAKKLYIGGSLGLNSYMDILNISAPSNPGVNIGRIYRDTSDSLLKSRNSSGVVTTYQPTNTKGDLLTHNNTTQIRLPVGTNGQILKSNSATSSGLEWESRKIAYIRDEKTTGTNGGGAPDTDIWFTRTLNTITRYPASMTEISLSGDTIVLEAGTYKFIANIPAHDVDEHLTRLFNVTTSSVIANGSSEYVNQGGVQTSSTIFAILTFGSTTSVRIQHIINNSFFNSDALGRATGYGTEVYTQVIVEKLD